MDYADIFTVYSYAAGTSAMYYKRTFYNSTSTVESDVALSDLAFLKDSKKYKMKLYVESGNSKNGVLVNVTWKLLLTKK
jgi:hypothetical protein